MYCNNKNYKNYPTLNLEPHSINTNEAYDSFYIIVRLQNTGIYRIYNLKALGCGA